MSEKNQENDKKIPVVAGSLFFLPLQIVCELLNLPTLIQNSYEDTRGYGWLTWRSLIRLSNNPTDLETSKKSTFYKMERMVKETPKIKNLLIDKDHLDVLWRPYHEWKALIFSSCLKTIEGREYWDGKIESEKALISKLSRASDPREKMKLLLACDLAFEKGCDHARQRMLDYLECHPEEREPHNCNAYIHFMLCACVSNLLRFSAWLVAEWELISYCENNRIPIDNFLPNYDFIKEEWNNPVAKFLEHVATQTSIPNDRSVSAHLGKLWAEHEYKENPASQITSKQKLLRNWLSGQGGRPTFKSIRSMTMAVASNATVKENGVFEAVGEGYARAFVLVETCWYAQRDLLCAGVPKIMIDDIFSSYLPEYQKAKQAVRLT